MQKRFSKGPSSSQHLLNLSSIHNTSHISHIIYTFSCHITFLISLHCDTSHWAFGFLFYPLPCMLSQPHPSLLFANRRSASPPLYSRLNHQWLLSSLKHHFEAETYHSPIHLSCHCNLPAHHTRVHVAHIHDWHIQVHSLHKMLQRQKHASSWERHDQSAIHIEMKNWEGGWR